MEDLNIRHFKLMNGEDIIGVVSVKNDDSWLIERPVLIQSNILGGFQFTHWFPFSNTKVHKLQFTSIINSTGIDQDIKEDYLNFVLTAKKRTRKIESDLDVMAQMEAAVDRRVEDEFNEGNLIKDKKKIIH